MSNDNEDILAEAFRDHVPLENIDGADDDGGELESAGARAPGRESSRPVATVPTTGELDLEERSSLRSLTRGSNTHTTEQDDGYDVEYRKLRLERVVLVGVWTSGTTAEIEASLAELQALAETAGSEVTEMMYQKRDKPDAGTYIGSGKVAELKSVVQATNSDTVICDGELSPGQLIALEKALDVKVIDRTMLILDIFAQHAKSREGKAQVALAQMEYLITRVRGWGSALSRQAGGRAGSNGGVGLRGPGETKIEADRRRLRQDMARLRHQLKGMTTAREVKRSRRKSSLIPKIAIAGYTNAGKSSLINGILAQSLANNLNRARLVPGRHKKVTGLEHLDKLVQVDQSPIGRTPRSNPATYTGVFDKVRKLFAETTEAKVRGYTAGRFSFNVKGGRCEACHGDGTLKIEMNFLPDVYVPCEVCDGARYNRETLEVLYKDKNISQVLEMPIVDAAEFFRPVTSISRYLDTLVDVGLGYVRLGQAATTLSGGEAQRVKLAAELQKRSNGRTIYILDEPTTGLHFEDIRKLMMVIQSLVDKGNSVVIIEHNLDVIKAADWIIDMGPEGGSGGGLVVAEGTPEEVAKVKGSYTGEYLKPMLSK